MNDYQRWQRQQRRRAIVSATFAWAIIAAIVTGLVVLAMTAGAEACA